MGCRPFFLLTVLPLLSVLGSQCDVDVVVASRAALMKDLRTVLRNFDLPVDGNVSCTETRDAIERRIDTLEAKLDKKMNEMLNKKLGLVLNTILDALLNVTEEIGNRNLLNEALDIARQCD